MKILTALTVVALLAIVITSCNKKDYTCSCTYRDSAGTMQKDVTTVKGTKTRAQNACNSHQSNLKYYSQSEVTCLLM
jgi:hypothetical protein